MTAKAWYSWALCRHCRLIHRSGCARRHVLNWGKLLEGTKEVSPGAGANDQKQEDKDSFGSGCSAALRVL